MRNSKSCIRFIICHNPLGEEQLIQEAADDPTIAAPIAAWKTVAGMTSTFDQTLVDPYVDEHSQYCSTFHKLSHPSPFFVLPSSHASLSEL
jgi:hypothetical protein